MDKIQEVKALGKENSVWSVRTSSAKVIVSQLEQDDHPLIVLPMRDVWISGVRFRGVKPTVCLSSQRLVVLSRPGFSGRVIWERIDRALMVEVSPYSHRAFEVSLSDGRVLKMRGMIGQERVEAMTERLCSEISAGVNRSTP
jgi:hypothetical protein